MTVRVRLLAGGLATVVALAGCGAAGARVIGPGATAPSHPSAPRPTTPPPTPGPAAPSSSTTTPSGGATTTAAPGVPPLDPGAVSQIDTELNALNAALSQSQSALDDVNPGDN